MRAARGTAHGIVVSAGEFTPDAREFVRGRNIELVSGKALAGILRGAASDAERSAAAPTCPKCGARRLSGLPVRASIPATILGLRNPSALSRDIADGLTGFLKVASRPEWRRLVVTR